MENFSTQNISDRFPRSLHSLAMVIKNIPQVFVGGTAELGETLAFSKKSAVGNKGLKGKEGAKGREGKEGINDIERREGIKGVYDRFILDLAGGMEVLSDGVLNIPTIASNGAAELKDSLIIAQNNESEKHRKKAQGMIGGIREVTKGGSQELKDSFARNDNKQVLGASTTKSEQSEKSFFKKIGHYFSRKWYDLIGGLWVARDIRMDDGSGGIISIMAPKKSGIEVSFPENSGTLITDKDIGTVTNAMLQGSITADKLLLSDITKVGTITSGEWQGTPIAWVKVNKAGSSLGDLETVSASDISSGTINNSRLTADVTLQGNTFNNPGQLVQISLFGELPVVSGANLTNLNGSQIASGIVNPLYGGTGLGSYSVGDLLYATSTTQLSRLAISPTAGLCLRVSAGGIPTWENCTAGIALTMQGIYDQGNTVTTTNNRDVSYTLADTATDSNFLINIATGSTGKFSIQGNGVDIFHINSSGVTVDSGGLTVTTGGANITGNSTVTGRLNVITATHGNLFIAGGNNTTTSEYNVALGTGALSGLTATAIGQNVAIGPWALERTTTGDLNTSVGSMALQFNTLGEYNTAVGGSALWNNTTGNHNSAFGVNALRWSNGNYNSAFGELGLWLNTSGSGNTSLGYSAGSSNTTGSNNTFVGYNAGTASSSGLTNATAIGYNAQVTASNSLILGNAANVGIGTTAPGAPLEVVRELGVTALTGTTKGTLHLQGDNDAANKVTAITFGGTSSDGLVPIGVMGMQATAGGSKLFFGTSNSYASGVNNTAMVINEIGNVGIGTTAPEARLDVQGLAANDLPTYSAEFLLATGWTSTNWTGDWATGWTHTVGNTSVLSQSKVAVNATKYQITYIVNNRTAGSFTLSFGGQEKSGITATGDFGPTTTSTANLTITPTNDFDGTIIISIKSITAGSTSLIAMRSSEGTSRLEVRANKSENNTFIGVSAGQYNTTGYQNTALGVAALQANTTGTYNTANGYNALHSNTTGNANSALGVYALQSNTTGGSNSALGASALLSNTTGGSNSALGQSTLGSNTTGSSNSALGANALLSNTTGGSNSALGASALRSNTTGNQNSALGLEALYSNTTGYQNTALGVAALQANTTGYNNIALGLNAGRYIADGNTANQTSNTSIYLGGITKSFASGDTNEIVIGYNTTGLGSNTVVLGNSSIITTALQGNVGIGTTSPGVKLEVAGDIRIPGTSSYMSTGNLYLSALANSDTYLRNGSTTNLFIQGSTGNVGIGTTEPGAKLEIVGSIPQIKLTYGPDTSKKVGFYANSAGTMGIQTTNGLVEYWDGTNAYRFRLFNANTETVYVASNGASYFNGGNVGIGTTAPASMLSVGASSQFQVNSSGAIAASTGITTSGGYLQSGASANTFTGATTFSATGTNAVALTGAPQASATASLLQLGSAISGGSASGTYLGINASAGFAGNLVDLQVNGVSQLKVTSGGAVTQAGALTISSGGINNTSGGITNAGAVSGATTVAASGTISSTAASAAFTANSATATAFQATAAPAASATSSIIQLGAAIAGGSASGTYFGINAAAGYAGNFVDYQVNGVSMYKITSAGGATMGGTLTVSTIASTGALAISSATNNNINLTVSGTGKVTLGDGGVTNYAQFDANGALTFAGAARPYSEIVLIPDDAVIPAANGCPRNQTDATNFSYFTVDCDPDADEWANWQFKMPQNYVNASNIQVDIYWEANATSGAAKFNAGYVAVANGEAFDAASRTDVAGTASATAGTAYYLNTTTMTLTTPSIEADDMVTLRILRDADDGTDTLAVDAKIIKVRVKFLVGS